MCRGRSGEQSASGLLPEGEEARQRQGPPGFFPASSAPVDPQTFRRQSGFDPRDGIAEGTDRGTHGHPPRKVPFAGDLDQMGGETTLGPQFHRASVVRRGAGAGVGEPLTDPVHPPRGEAEGTHQGFVEHGEHALRMELAQGREFRGQVFSVQPESPSARGKIGQLRQGLPANACWLRLFGGRAGSHVGVIDAVEPGDVRQPFRGAEFFQIGAPWEVGLAPGLESCDPAPSERVTGGIGIQQMSAKRWLTPRAPQNAPRSSGTWAIPPGTAGVLVRCFSSSSLGMNAAQWPPPLGAPEWVGSSAASKKPMNISSQD